MDDICLFILNCPLCFSLSSAPSSGHTGHLVLLRMLPDSNIGLFSLHYGLFLGPYWSCG